MHFIQPWNDLERWSNCVFRAYVFNSSVNNQKEKRKKDVCCFVDLIPKTPRIDINHRFIQHKTWGANINNMGFLLRIPCSRQKHLIFCLKQWLSSTSLLLCPWDYHLHFKLNYPSTDHYHVIKPVINNKVYVQTVTSQLNMKLRSCFRLLTVTSSETDFKCIQMWPWNPIRQSWYYCFFSSLKMHFTLWFRDTYSGTWKCETL